MTTTVWSLPDGYQDLKEAVDKMNAAAGAETRNASADSAAVKKVQEPSECTGILMRDAGWDLRAPDGKLHRAVPDHVWV